MVKKYIENFDDLTRLSQQIIKRHPWGYLQCAVHGARGDGKSAFGLHVGREVYQFQEGLSRTDAWEKMLGVGNYRKEHPCILFDLNDVINTLEPMENIDFDNILEWQKENTMLFKLWDDTGMHGGKYRFFTDVKLVEALQGEMDTIRFILTCFMTTSPELSSVLKFMQDYKDQLIIRIKKHPDAPTKYNKMAVVKKYYEHYTGAFKKRVAWQTGFSCYVDPWVYEEYTRMKARAILENRARLKQIIKESQKIKHGKKSENEVMDDMGVPQEMKPILSSK